MKRRVVVACFGDRQSTDKIQQLAAEADVIAVALDFGGAVSLNEIREAALAAGAVRCHALDVREEFARACLLPAVRSRAFANPSEACPTLAPAFAGRKLEEIAAIENASVVAPDHVVVSSRPVPTAATAPVHLEIGFEDGMPVSVNGVHMSLIELMESLETITGEPALAVLDRQIPKQLDSELV